MLVAAALVFSRQPDAILHPQFYGEDGHVWFADAYNRGWFGSLFRTQDGYFQTLPRLAAALAVIWPLRFAPLITNLAGLAVQLLPVPILLSSRSRRWGPLPFRCVLALVYVALPNSRELNLSITEAQWHLALAACLLVLADPPRSTIARALEIGVFVLCGLTGPFCILLLPLALVFWRFRLDTWRGAVVAILAGGAAAQLAALLLFDSARQQTLPLGASVAGLIRILGGQVFSAALAGSNMLAAYGGTVLLIALALFGAALLGYAAFRSGAEYRLFLAFSVFLLAASLANPKTGAQFGWTTAWQVLAAMPAAHYWFFPTLATLWGLVQLSLGPKRTQLSQAIGILLVPVVLVGLVRDWQHAAYPDTNFGYYAAKVAASKPGEAMVIPEAPPGWTLRLVKR